MMRVVIIFYFSMTTFKTVDLADLNKYDTAVAYAKCYTLAI